MRILRTFQQSDVKHMLGLIKSYPIAKMVTCSEQGIEVNHVPFLFSKNPRGQLLKGYISKDNALLEAVSKGAEVLLTFAGADAKVYQDKVIDTGGLKGSNKDLIVHVKGQLHFVDDPQQTLSVLQQLAQNTWTGKNRKEKKQIRQQIEKMLPEVMGVEISVSDMQGQWRAPTQPVNKGAQQKRPITVFNGAFAGQGKNGPALAG